MRGTILPIQMKDGTKRYRTIIRIHGKQEWKTWDRKRDAENYLDGLSPELRDGTYRDIQKATFKEYLDHYQDTHLIPENFKPSTYNGYRSIVEAHLLPEFKNYPMQAITTAKINSFVARLLKGNRSRRTVRNILILLGKILTKATAEDYLKRSPVIELPKADRDQKGRALKPDEIQSILSACEGKCHLMIATAIATGMRRGEQFGLEWENVDFDGSVIKIRKALFWKFGKYYERKDGDLAYSFVAPKTPESVRDIDLSPELRKELRELYLKSGKKGLVFSTPAGTPMNPENFVNRDFAAALKKAEAQRKKDGLAAIGHVRWHDLRHTFGSLKLDQGEDIAYVSKQMGHAKVSITADIYMHQLRERRPEAAAKTDFLIFGK